MPKTNFLDRNKLISIKKREELKDSLGKQYQKKYGSV